MGLFDFLKKENKKTETVENTPSIEQGGFERAFTEVQKDMISICLEYVEDKADKVYIYSSNERNAITSNFFYEIGGLLYKKHKLPEGYDVSVERQRTCIEIINEDMGKIAAVCSEYKQEAPTEVRIIYDITKGKVNAKYRYDEVFASTNKNGVDISNEWFNEISVSLK